MTAYPWACDDAERRRRQPRRHGGGRWRRAGVHATAPARAAYAALDRPPLVGAEHRPRVPRAAARARSAPATDGTSPPSACDDGPYGKGTGGELRYKVTVGPRSRETVWIAVAATRGRDSTARCATRTASWRTRPAHARSSASTPRSTCPVTGSCRTRSTGASRTSPTSRRRATDLNLRFVDEGKAYPAPVGEDPAGHVLRRRLPGLPVAVRHRRRVHGVRGRRARAVRDDRAHLIALRDVSDALNERSGKVAHEIVTDGSVYFGANTERRQHGRDGQVPERRRAGVALDRRRPLPRLALRLLGPQPEVHRRHAGRRPRRLARGPGQRRARRAWAPEKLDNTVYFIRGLYDLADMAASKRDRATEQWAGGLADQLRARFDPQWWDAAQAQYADSLERDQRRDPAEALDRRHADGGRADRRRRGRSRPRAARPRHHGAGRARDVVLQRRRRRSTAASSTRAAAAARTARASGSSSRSTPRSRPSARATTAARRDQQQRYTDANAAPMFRARRAAGRAAGDPAVAGPGTRTSTAAGLPLDGHAGLGPLRHGLAGDPPAARRAARRWARAGSRSSRRCRTASRASPGATSALGDGSVDVAATRAFDDGDACARACASLRDRADAASGRAGRVTLDGRAVRKPDVRRTNRGYEVTVKAPPQRAPHPELAG